MFKKNAIRVASVGIIAGALIAGSSMAAQAAVTTPPPVTTPPASTQFAPFYLVDSNDGSAAVDGATHQFEDDFSGSPVPANTAFDDSKVFLGDAAATDAYVFISPRGSEGSKSTWSAYLQTGFVGSDKHVFLAPAKLGGLTGGVGAASVKSAGGDYSLGLAYTSTQGNVVTSTAFTYVTVTPGTGTWTAAEPNISGGGGPAAVGSPFVQNLSATVVAPAEALTLVAPSNPTTTLTTALVNGVSTSTGNLGAFSVSDTRITSHPGWTLTTAATDFTLTGDASKTIDKKQLGIAPVLSSSPAGSAVTAAAATIAGSAPASAPFAAASNSAVVGTSVFDANLTFVAPTGSKAGTYTSKLTVTLASK